MAVIENFDAISVQEQMKFAEALLNTINSESIFSDETNFKISKVEADEMTGRLEISLESEGLIEVAHNATWTCADEDDLYSVPDYDDIDEEESIYDAAKRSFKTLSVELEGYTVSLDIDDINAESSTEVEVDNYSHEDSGIGSNEFWGVVSYDSRPYLLVEGAIIKECTCYITLYVEPVDTFEEPEPEIE